MLAPERDSVCWCISAACCMALMHFYRRGHTPLVRYSGHQSLQYVSMLLFVRKRLLITSKSRAQPRRSLRSRRRNIGTLSTRQSPSVSSLARKQLRHLNVVLLFTVFGIHCSSVNAL